VIAESPLAERFWAEGRLDDCPVIDMHGHMGPWPAIYFPRAEPERMIHSMDQANVRMLVFSSHEALFSPHTGNDYSIRVARQYPDRLRAMLAVNGNFMDQVERDMARFDAVSDVVLGLKFLAPYHEVSMDDPRYDDVWAWANERKMIVTAHTWGGRSEYCGRKQVENVASRFPEVRLMMAHSLLSEWDSTVHMVTEYPHVYADLTAVFEWRGSLELLVERGCGERMVFGTDLPWFSPLHGVGCVLSAHLDDDARRNILYRNAARLLAPHVPAMAELAEV
jgi:predicted TIM-barrel fold metal-dependent hydrolase